MSGEYKIGDFTVSGQIVRESSKTVTYLAHNPEGRKCLATVVDRSKCLSRAHLLKTVQNKKGSEGIPVESIQKYVELETALVQANRRVLHLRHKNVTEVYQVIYDPEKKQHYIFSEYVPGNSVDKATQTIPLKKTLSIFCDVLEGMEFIHQCGFLHGNLKPRNLLVSLNNHLPDVKISEWGYALPIENAKEYYVRPTAAYVAPELVTGRRPIDERADIYAFNVNVYQCIAKRKAFPERCNAIDEDSLIEVIKNEKLPDPPSLYNDEVTPKLDEIILETFRPDPSDRPFRRAAEYLKALREIIGDL